MGDLPPLGNLHQGYWPTRFSTQSYVNRRGLLKEVMGGIDESDISYVSGQIDGYLLCWRIHSDEDKTFDDEHWETLYGSKLVFSNVPAYHNEEARHEDRDKLVITDWDDRTGDELSKRGRFDAR